MNIEKLAKHLKEFSLDEIEMIAEYDCKSELEFLMNSNKIIFEQGIYKYVENLSSDKYELFTNIRSINSNISIINACNEFLNEYVKNNCKIKTFSRYRTIINRHIIPYLKKNYLYEINNDDIKNLYYQYKKMYLRPKTIRNYLSLLNQIIKYYQHKKIIDRKCLFQVKRITYKNEFDINRILFEE